MEDNDWLAERFEEHRPRLRAAAYRMLGSVSEADDAVQEAWLRVSRADTARVENLGAWLTTVVARVCLNMLRSRRSRRCRRPSGRVRAARHVRGAVRGDRADRRALADRCTVAGGKIVAIDVLADPERLSRLDLTVLG